jgi:hypothetical protein
MSTGSKTGLIEMTYSRIVNHADSEWAFVTAVSICFGLGLDLAGAELLLRAAGHSLHASEKRRVYAMLFTDMRGWTIAQCNVYLNHKRVPLLGSRKNANTKKR